VRAEQGAGAKTLEDSGESFYELSLDSDRILLAADFWLLASS
jgi:hypothetical protein